MAWAVLIISGVLEAVWALFLKASDGFSKLGPTIGFGIFAILSFGGLAYALKSLPVGPAYAVWTGIGAALTAIIGMAIFGDAVSVAKIVSILLIIAGVIGLNLFAGS